MTETSHHPGLTKGTGVGLLGVEWAPWGQEREEMDGNYRAPCCR